MIEVAPKETEIMANWDEANLYCTFLEVDGKKGWRLPTTDELKEIYNSAHDLRIPTKAELNEMYNYGNNFSDSFYWSVTGINGFIAWKQSLSFSDQYSALNGTINRVRAVRNL